MGTFSSSGFITLLIGCGLLVYCITILRHAWVSRLWPSAPGEILKSRVDIIQSQKPRSTGYSFKKRIIQYRYQVDGTFYVGNKINFMGDTPFLSVKGRAFKKKYPAGKRVDVIYNPKNPMNCKLERRESPWLIIILILFAVLAIVLGIRSAF